MTNEPQNPTHRDRYTQPKHPYIPLTQNTQLIDPQSWTHDRLTSSQNQMPLPPQQPHHHQTNTNTNTKNNNNVLILSFYFFGSISNGEKARLLLDTKRRSSPRTLTFQVTWQQPSSNRVTHDNIQFTLAKEEPPCGLTWSGVDSEIW